MTTVRPKRPVRLYDEDGVAVYTLRGLEVEMATPPENAQDELPVAASDGGASEVWSHYVNVMGPRQTALDAQGRQIIRDALKVASIAECKRAIDGNKASPFHQGENDRRKKYTRLSHVLKGKRGVRTTREQIDLFLDIADKADSGSPLTSAPQATINLYKQEVRDATEFPGDRTVVERGEKAAAWLRNEAGLWLNPESNKFEEVGSPRSP